jgi:hypothetical protein
MKRIALFMDNKFNILGLIVSVIAVVILIILHRLDYEYEAGWHDRIFITNHVILILGLLSIMLTKETYDDERVQRIRYGLLKVCYSLTISFIMAYLEISTLDRVEFSIYIVLYIIEFVLILYQVLFRIFLLVNPSWIFKESKRSNFSFYWLFSCLLFLIGWLIYVVIQYKI